MILRVDLYIYSGNINTKKLTRYSKKVEVFMTISDTLLIM